MKTKLIEGYDYPYTIGEDGVVTGGRYLKPLKHTISVGYPRVTLYKDKKPYGKHIHRLLAQAFIPNPDNLPQVNHKDGNKLNYVLSNLEWCTVSENITHAFRVLGRKNWNTGKQLVDRSKTCEFCLQVFRYKKKQRRFCNNRCAAKYDIKQGVLTRE